MIKIRESSVKPLWVEDYYDGPLTGFCEYRGIPYYYVAQENWIYFLYPLKEETWKAHLSVHMDFCEFVGDHWNDGFKSKGSGVKPESEHHKFYDKYKNLVIPKADELPPRFWFVMGGEKGQRRLKFLKREWRIERLKRI
jgi:hypothetical protein